jgi:hypothetical protein
MKLTSRLGKAEVIRDGDEAFQLAHTDPIHTQSVFYLCVNSNFRIERHVRCFVQEKTSKANSLIQPSQRTALR